MRILILEKALRKGGRTIRSMFLLGKLSNPPYSLQLLSNDDIGRSGKLIQLVSLQPLSGKVLVSFFLSKYWIRAKKLYNVFVNLPTVSIATMSGEPKSLAPIVKHHKPISINRFLILRLMIKQWLMLPLLLSRIQSLI